MGETFLFDNHKKSEVEGCPKRKKPHSDFDTHFRMFLHILRLVEDVSRPISHIIITNWHALSLTDHVQRRMVPATMLRWNSGVSWDFHHRRTKFFISHVWSPPKNILCPVTFFWNQNPHVVGSPHRWQPISFPFQKHLPSLQLACADQNHYELHSVGMDGTRTDLFRHCCSWDTPHQCSQFSKMTLYPSIEFHYLLKRIYCMSWRRIILMVTWFFVRTIKSHSRKKFDGRI